MGTRKAVIGASMVLILNVVPPAEGAPRLVRARADTPVAGVRTDRLTGKQLDAWRRIIEIVKAQDRDGQPLSPTLQRLWDTVDSSQHTVFIEMVESTSYFAGRFEITKVDPDGRAHEGVIFLNLRAIDRTSTGPAAARADGFVPLKGLKKNERYAEVLGHELAHAAWHVASVERARLAESLQAQLEDQARMLLAARASGLSVEGPQAETDLERLARDLEEPAETAERAIWEELRAGR